VTDLAEHFGVYLSGMHLICCFVVALGVLFSLRLQMMNTGNGNRWLLQPKIPDTYNLEQGLV